MQSSKMTQKLSLFLLLAVSIPKISADTNTHENLDSNSIETIQAQAPSAPENQFILECRAYAEYLEIIAARLISVNMIANLPLCKAVDQIFQCGATIKELPDNASNKDIYISLSMLHYCSTYLIKLLEKDNESIQEFSPEIASKETIGQSDLIEIAEKLGISFKTMMIKANENIQDFWGNLAVQVRSQLIKMDTILHTINNNINTNMTIVNKKDIANDIKDHRRMLQQIQKDLTAAGSDQTAVKMVFQVNKAIIAFLKEAQTHKFRKWGVFDPISELTRNQNAIEDTPADLYINIMQASEELDRLEKDAEKIDLTTTNKITRFVGDYVIDPIEKYHLDTYALTLFVGGWYAAYYFDDTFFKDKNSLFRRMFGYRNHSLGKQVYVSEAKEAISQPDKPIKWLGKTEEFIYDQMHNLTPIGAFLSLTILDRVKGEWKDVKPRIMNRCSYWFNKLKGGALAKNAEKYRKFDQVISTITFDDVIGLEYEKSLVYPHLKYIKDPERWDSNDLTPPTGILLTGPTRSGKTFFAKAICGEIHRQNPDKTIRFISIDPHDIKADGIATWMGVAKMLAPCVLFIDEIDLLGLQRNQDKTLLSDFLQALSGVTDKDPKKQVIVVGTTNKPENIDSALIQSGRFALEIRFKYPNLEERKEFIRKRLDKFAIDPEAFDINIDKLARETQEKTFEDIKLMIDTAFIHVGIKGQMISQPILDWALDTQLRKIIDIDSKNISATEKQLLAAHYAGQALVHLLLNMEEKIAKTTIRQVVVKVKEESVWAQLENKDLPKQTGFDQGGLFTYFEHDSLDVKSQAELIKKAKTFLGARIAERILTNNCSSHFGWKKNAAFNMIKSIVADGIDFKSLSQSGQNEISDLTHLKLKEFEREIEQLLLAHKEALTALMNALYEKQILTISDIEAIINSVEQKSESSNQVAIAA